MSPSIPAILLAACALNAVSAAQSRAAVPRDRSRSVQVSGAVVSDITGEPLSRVRVYLKSISGETSNLAVEADAAGRFAFSDVAAGRYTISAQRDGYLPGSAARQGSVRLPAVLQLEAGKPIRDITFRLRPWSVMAGRIRFNDAEPAIGVLVQIFQDAFLKGRRTFSTVASARTNDRGEFRIPGLRAGSYYVAASYDRPLSPEYREHDPVDERGNPVPQFRYSTTFFPSAQRLGDAGSIRVGEAEEVTGIDIFLQPVRTVRIWGTTLSGISGRPIKVPNLSLRRLSGDERSSINAAIALAPRGDGFEIRGVAAGPYLLVADALDSGRRLFARVPLVVADANIEDVRVLLEPERPWRGTLKIEDAPGLRPKSLRVVLEPRSDLNPLVSADVRDDGSFQLNVVPGEVYDLYVQNAPDDLYVKSVKVGNTEIDSQGVDGQHAGAAVPLEVVITARSATLAGRAAAGASVTVVPDPADGRPQRYRTSFADQYGIFQVRGIAPGRYTAFAYHDEPPCDLFDTTALAECRPKGKPFTAVEGSQALLDLANE